MADAEPAATSRGRGRGAGACGAVRRSAGPRRAVCRAPKEEPRPRPRGTAAAVSAPTPSARAERLLVERRVDIGNRATHQSSGCAASAPPAAGPAGDVGVRCRGGARRSCSGGPARRARRRRRPTRASGRTTSRAGSPERHHLDHHLDDPHGTVGDDSRGRCRCVDPA